MKKSKLKTRLIIFAVLSVFMIFVYIIVSHRVDTDLFYCKELARELGWLKMKQFHCSYIEKGERQTIQISFKLKNRNKFANEDFEQSEDEVYCDIAAVKKEISLYLEKHPNNELNEMKIVCIFNELPGESCYMYNYDYRLEEELQKPDGFRYFSWVTVDITEADDFKDACSIKLAINDKSELQLLEEWKNLKCLDLVGMEFSEEDKKYLCKILPNCTIYCCGEIISN